MPPLQLACPVSSQVGRRSAPALWASFPVAVSPRDSSEGLSVSRLLEPWLPLRREARPHAAQGRTLADQEGVCDLSRLLPRWPVAKAQRRRGDSLAEFTSAVNCCPQQFRAQPRRRTGVH